MGRPAIQCQAVNRHSNIRCPERKLPGLSFCLRHELALNGAGDDETESTHEYETTMTEEEFFERRVS